jgi:peptidoglycan/LPS O-acetylase OafA/YrhL
MLWLAMVLFLSMTIAILRGGRMVNLGDIHLNHWWLLPLGFVLQIGAQFVPSSAVTWGVALILSSYVPLLLLVIINRDRPGLWLAGLGILMNFVVIALNAGMPVLAEAAEVASGFAPGVPVIAESFKHVVLNETSRLVFLADVIPIRIANYGQVLSLGDVFLAVGLGRFVEFELRRPIRWFKRGARAQAGSASRY